MHATLSSNGRGALPTNERNWTQRIHQWSFYKIVKHSKEKGKTFVIQEVITSNRGKTGVNVLGLLTRFSTSIFVSTLVKVQSSSSLFTIAHSRIHIHTPFTPVFRWLLVMLFVDYFSTVCDWDTMQDSRVCTMWESVVNTDVVISWQMNNGETMCRSENRRRKKRSTLGKLIDKDITIPHVPYSETLVYFDYFYCLNITSKNRKTGVNVVSLVDGWILNLKCKMLDCQFLYPC